MISSQPRQAHEDNDTLGALVSPVMDHSLKPGGASTDVTFAFSTNGSLMMFTVNPFPLLTFLAVSLIRGELKQEKDTMGGQLVTLDPTC